MKILKCENLERELSFKLLKSDSFDVRKKDSRLKEEAYIDLKNSSVFGMNLFQHHLERLACSLLYVTVGRSSVLECPSSFCLAYESFEM